MPQRRRKAGTGSWSCGVFFASNSPEEIKKHFNEVFQSRKFKRTNKFGESLVFEAGAAQVYRQLSWSTLFVHELPQSFHFAFHSLAAFLFDFGAFGAALFISFLFFSP